MTACAQPAVPWHRSIRFRLVAVAIAVELCMLALLIGNSVRLIGEALEQQTRTRILALTPLFNAALNRNVFQRNYVELQSVLDQLVRSDRADIRYLAVFDSQGRPLAAAGQAPPAAAPLDQSVGAALGDLVYDTEIKLAMFGEDIGSVRFGLSLLQMANLRDNVVRQGLVIAAFEILLSLLILASGGYLITRHVGGLVAATRRVAGGDYTSRIAVPGRDEVGLLAENFNRMAAAIEDRVGQLQESESRFRAMFDSVSEAIFLLDAATGRIVDVNRAQCKVFACTREEALGATPGDFSLGEPPYDPGAAQTWMEQALRDGPQTFEWRARGFDGRLFWAEIDLRPLRIGDHRRLLAVVRDVTERRLVEGELRQAASVFEHANEGIMITDADTRIVDVNGAFTAITGFARDEAIGRTPAVLASGRHDREFYAAMWRSIGERGSWRGEIWNRRKDGSLYAELLTISVMRDEHGGPHRYVGLFSDITEIKEQQHRLEDMAHYDALTRLPNRILLADRLRQATAQCARSNRLLAVAYVDLDGFKPVNDIFGHDAGDQLLIEAARRFSECIRAGDTACRLGGDEFALLVSSLASVDECMEVFNRILAAIAAPFLVDGREVSISASIGVTLYPLDDADADTLLRHSDQAMYVAKRSGRGRFHLFDPQEDRDVAARREARARIEEALSLDQFTLHYQPKVNMRSGRVVGAEALVRWQHPQRGLLLPGEFLPLIEDTAFAVDLGRWIMQTAVAQADAWRKSGRAITVSINMAARHLKEPGFVGELQALLQRHPDLPPSAVELEVLETAAIADFVEAGDVIHSSHQLGVRFALDDFGTGYSSMSYLKRLQVDTLKIDQSFVKGLLDDEGDRAIVEGMIGLARVFGRQVIAEGVESAEVGKTLLAMGCELAQGYGIARPMPAAAVLAWIDAWEGGAGWRQPLGLAAVAEDLPR